MPNQQPYTGSPKVILAFDIGTTNSAVSYCILELGKIPQIHRVSRFPGQEPDDNDAKVPSILYYDDVGYVRAIGSAALNESFVRKAEDEGWAMAALWKLRNHPKHIAYTHIKTDDISPLPPSKSTEDVLTDFIRYLALGAQAYIEENHDDITLPWPLSSDDTIEFVFTYPNAWEDAQQQQYRRAAESAGLVPPTTAGRSRIHLISEGEASLHYCLSSLPDQSGQTSPQGVVVVDAGGGVIDMNMYSIKFTNNSASCEEIAPPESRLQGSVLVTRRAATLFQGKLRGSPFSSPEDIADLAREFDETAKLNIGGQDKSVRIKIGDVRDNHPAYNIKRGLLELSGAEATRLFEDSIQAIINTFERQLRFTTTKITMVFLVGGFASNRWLWSRLRTYFKTQGIELSCPDDHVNKAAAHGAVLSQITRNNPLVASRFSHDAYAAKRANQKGAAGTQQDPITKIMELTGLRQVKSQVMSIKGTIDILKRQGVPINKERLNLVLLGNPGTGKTTVARLYAEFLQSIKALPGNAFLETTGSKLAFEGVQGAQKLIDEALKAGGGAIFIDEAYQLASDFNLSGKQVLDFLLAEMENRVGTLVFILAGYNKEMEKFFEHNPGLRSRVPYQIQFADYTDQELMVMLDDLVYKQYNGRMKVDDSINGLYARIAIKRLGRGRGSPGFGNARALQNMFAKIRQRQAQRLEKEQQAGGQVDDFFLTMEDIIGPDPSKVLPHSVPWAKLQKMVGLQAVKNSVRDLFALLETNYERELAEKEPMYISLNRVFLGSPGTGKTTVAKLYGQILVDLSMLSNGEVVVKNPADFIGAHLGESEKNTKAILDNTRGKVLVIDEAYMLHNKNTSANSYQTAVIDTMVAEIQSVPGEDRCVLLLGYKNQMEEMFQNVNPGLSRRFAIEDAFVFEDFTEPELLQILEFKLKEQDLYATDAAKNVALSALSRMKNRPNFGNAGEVENLLSQAKARYQGRMRSVPASKRMEVEFEPQDFDPNFNRSQNASQNLAKMFEDVVGCEDVIKKLEYYQTVARVMTKKGRDMRTLIPSNFVFKGPPGTGKTTVARKLGQVYYDMGYLASGDVIECSASDLVGQFVGHTGPKTKALFEKALGKVLFIDEAYRLSEGQFAKEAMDEIVGLMTNERFMNKIVIVLAGYEHEMNALLGVNPGLSSRFSEEIIFHNMTPDQCLKLLDKELQKQDIVVPELADETSPEYSDMHGVITHMSSFPSWGNGRDVKTLAKRMTQKAFANVALHDALTLSADEVLSVMQAMSSEQQARQNAARPTSHAPWGAPFPTAAMSGFSPPPPSISTSGASKRAQAPPPRPPSPTDKFQEQLDPKAAADDQPPPSERTSAGRDPGVSDAIWNQLQADLKAQQEARKKAEEEQRRLEQALKEAEEKRKAEIACAEALERERLAAIEKADLERKKELERQLQEVRRREAEREAAAEKAAAALRKRREEEAERRRKEKQIQQKIRNLGLCPMGYDWVRQGNGYRCTGGSHFISHSQLGSY